MTNAKDTADKIRKLLQRKHRDDRTDAMRLDELRRVFLQWDLTPIQTNKANTQPNVNTNTSTTGTTFGSSSLEATEKWKAWLKQQLLVYSDQLCRVIREESRRTAVRTMWGIVAGLRCDRDLRALLLLKYCDSLVSMDDVRGMDKGMRNMVHHEFVDPYADAVYSMLIALTSIAGREYQRLGHRSSSKRQKTALKGGVGTGGESVMDGVNDDDNKHDGQDTDEQHSSDHDLLYERLVDMLVLIPILSSQSDVDKLDRLFPTLEGDGSGSRSGSVGHSSGNGGSELQSADSDSDDDSDTDSDDDDDDDAEEDETTVSSATGPSKDAMNGRKRKGVGRRRDRRRMKRRSVRGLECGEVRCHRKALSDAWFAVLRLPLPPSALKQALQFLPRRVLPCVSRPLRFADFFMQAYGQAGGVIPVLSLDGLFLLMTEHGLEYPLFYKQLYKLIVPSLFCVKYRVRFFDLLVKCLSKNEMLPAHVVAAFVKRLLRCCMSAPPSGALFSLALTSNLLRKHQECGCLIHRDRCGVSGSESVGVGVEIVDGFDSETDDPSKAGALSSSLWELDVLAKHYHPAVCALARSVGSEDHDTAHLYDMDDFRRHTYKSLFDQEHLVRRVKKRVKSTPLTFVEPSSLFGGVGVGVGVGDDEEVADEKVKEGGVGIGGKVGFDGVDVFAGFLSTG